jgi:predicted extracellular nuclease
MPDLTVMTWNIQNLFPVRHGDGPATQQEYDDKVAGLAEVINAVEPDVLALQEVGPEQGLAGIDFDNRLVGSPDGRGIRVALLSPRLLSNSVDITTFPLGVVPVQSRDLIFDNPATPENEALSAVLGRGVLSATVRAGGEQVTVLVAHLKSKLISYPRQPGVVGGSMFAPNDEGERLRYAGYALYRRTAEAMTCRAALDTVLAGAGDQPGEGAGTGQANPVIYCVGADLDRDARLVGPP